MHPREAAVLDHIHLDELVATLSGLIPFESCHGREVEVQEHMAHLMGTMGMEVDRWEIDLDAVGRHPASGVEIERSRALGVVGRWGSDQGPALILNGHVDVVPAGDSAGWTVPPFEATVRDGRVYGRGSVDMKGALCCALQAVKAIMRAGVTLRGSVRIQSVVGEEDGGLGTLATIVRGHTGDAAIVMEPTELAVAPAQAGALSFRITLPGRAAHGALRTEGADPLEGFAPLFAALRALEHERNRRLRHPMFVDDPLPYALCVGKLRAGIWPSTVAESLVLEGRYGVGIGESCAAAREEFEGAVATAARSHEALQTHPPAVEWWGARFEPAAIDADHPLVTTVAGSVEAITGRPPPVRGMSFGADMHLLVNHGGIPTVMFGPGDIRKAHAPDEFVPLADLEVATRTLALTILRFCGAEG